MSKSKTQLLTKLYGASDDLIESEGGIYGEGGRYNTTSKDPILIEASDGTHLKMWYGKPEGGIWNIEIITKGTLFDRFTECIDDGDDIYSDIVYFKPGLLWIKWDGEILE